MNKILCIGDPHIKVESITDFELFEEKLYKLIAETKPSLIVVLGDILHTHEKLNTIALNKAYTFIDALRKQALTYVLVGNHDMIKNTEYLSTNHWLNSLKEWNNVVIVDKVVHYTFPSTGSNLLFIPYVSCGLFKDALATNEYEWKNADIIFAHQEFKGCKMGAIISEHGDVWEDELPYVISGHIHSNQTIGKNVYYPGSALQHAFGESEKNIIAILTLPSPSINSVPYTLDEVDLGLPRKKIISCLLQDIDTVRINQDQGKRTRITVKGASYDEFKLFKSTEKYRQLTSKGVTIAFRKDEVKIDNEGGSEKDGEGGGGDEKKLCEEDTIETCFDNMLLSLIKKEDNTKLYQLYERIVKCK
jgi:DNA repair exonuclease SbcCD nuclease subunit